MKARDPRVLTAAGHSRDSEGTLWIGRVPATSLVERFGTPLVVFDAGVFERNLAEYEAACDAGGIALAYACKALLVVGIARRLRAHPGIALDVCSLGEILTAERAGVPAARMYLHGCGKSDEELDAALEGRVARIIVDGISELERLAVRAGARAVAADIGLRINTGIAAHTHEFVRTGGENTKFGIAPRELEQALTILRTSRMRLTTLHAHIGSQIFEEAPYAASLETLLEVAAASARCGTAISELIVGGGFGVEEDVASPAFDRAGVLADLARRTREGAERLGIPAPRLGVEPGRDLVAAAGTTLYRVVAIKDAGDRRFVVIDGGMADNPRPAIYGAFHQPLVARSAARGMLGRATICGRSCENDELVEAELPRDLALGDLLGLCTTGAYTYAMASNYNRFPRPAVVEVEDGEARLLVRRETLDDVLRNDLTET